MSQFVIPVKPVLSEAEGAGIHCANVLLDACFRRHDRPRPNSAPANSETLARLVSCAAVDKLLAVIYSGPVMKMKNSGRTRCEAYVSSGIENVYYGIMR